ncbi:MAG: HAD family hydrolase [Dehalococcoidia bacterium]
MSRTKALFFDLYNTLARFWPPTEEIQVAACQALGLQVTPKGIIRGYALADAYFSQENATRPLAERTAQERGRFFAEYERLILQGTGVEVSTELASQVWQQVSQVPKELALFEDVLPALRRLKERGLTLGLLSNVRWELGELGHRLGLDAYLDFTVTSQEAGAEKPHPPIFLLALERAGVGAGEAMHVGDQYQSDVLGARAVGIIPVLVDRANLHPHRNDCIKIRSLAELEAHL